MKNVVKYPNEKPDLHLVSFSGGKDSTAMLLHMMELGMKIDIVLHCDTGVEFPAMNEHVEKIKKLVENAGIKFVTLKSEISFYDYMFNYIPNRKNPKLKGKVGYSWAGSKMRWCTTQLKINLLKRYKSSLMKDFNVIEYIGLASDEQYRLQRESNKNLSHRHPLVEWGWTEKDCINYCYEKGFDWGGLYEIFDRVSCWCCPLQSLQDLRMLRKHFPDLWETLREWDKRTWRKFRFDFTVEELEKRFELEDERLSQGLPISGHCKEFREALKERLGSDEE